jgi:hypothetical protein
MTPSKPSLQASLNISWSGNFRTAFLLQVLQEFDELSGANAMLQLTVATHVQVTDKVILLCQSMISLPDPSKISDRWSYTCAAYRPACLM